MVMALLAIWQRSSGPTYPVAGSVKVGNNEIRYKMPRSHSGDASSVIKIKAPEGITGVVKYRRFKSHDEWSQRPMTREGENLTGGFTRLAPAGKMMYIVYLKDVSGSFVPATPEAVVLRFKGDVPAWVLVPHILAMFLAMVAGLRAGFDALAKDGNPYKYCIWTLVLFAAGGLVLGPVVQKYAFDAYWTGWPFGKDLTDNKTLVSVLMWAWAAWRARKNPEKAGKWVAAAAAVMLAVYLVPHSMLGSEIDYTKLPGA